VALFLLRRFPEQFEARMQQFGIFSSLGPHRAYKHPPSAYPKGMSIRCLFRVHRPMLTSIVRRQDRYTALCDSCGLPIERRDDSRWTACEPLASRRDQVA
jgi:hypothetical protein